MGHLVKQLELFSAYDPYGRYYVNWRCFYIGLSENWPKVENWSCESLPNFTNRLSVKYFKTFPWKLPLGKHILMASRFKFVCLIVNAQIQSIPRCVRSVLSRERIPSKLKTRNLSRYQTSHCTPPAFLWTRCLIFHFNNVLSWQVKEIKSLKQRWFWNCGSSFEIIRGSWFRLIASDRQPRSRQRLYTRGLWERNRHLLKIVLTVTFSTVLGNASRETWLKICTQPWIFKSFRLTRKM